MLEGLGEDYIRTAYPKGLPDRAVLTRHALRNAAVPIVSVIGIGFALLIGGVVITETVFNIPGLGRLVVEAVLARDYPIIRSEEHTSELQSLMRISYAVFCLKKKKNNPNISNTTTHTRI